MVQISTVTTRQTLKTITAVLSTIPRDTHQDEKSSWQSMPCSTQTNIQLDQARRRVHLLNHPTTQFTCLCKILLHPYWLYPGTPSFQLLRPCLPFRSIELPIPLESCLIGSNRYLQHHHQFQVRPRVHELPRSCWYTGKSAQDGDKK